MPIRTLLLLAACATAPGAALAQTDPTPPPGPALKPYLDTSLGYMRGADVINRCTEVSAESASFCFSYIAGVYDSVRAYETWLSIREFCIPAGTPQSELRDVVVARIEKNPNDRLAQGASVVIRALKERYPCAVEPVPAPTPPPPPAPAPEPKKLPAAAPKKAPAVAKKAPTTTKKAPAPAKKPAPKKAPMAQH